ncbi:MAG: zf-HC2 domain-containing protein [Candidatus Binatia bacterium]
MQCREAQRALDAFADGVTDVLTSLDLQEHLDQCSRCRHELELEYRLRRLLTEPGLWERAPAHLRRQTGRRLTGRRRLLQTAGVAVMVLSLALALGLFRSARPTLPQLVQVLEAATQTHQGQGNAAPTVRSTDVGRLHTALTARFPHDFGVPRPGSAVRLLGGSPCTLEGVPCRVVLYERSGQRISYFVFPYPRSTITAVPQARILDRTIYARRSGKYHVLFWREGSVICALVSDLAPQALLPLARSAIAQERTAVAG